MSRDQKKRRSWNRLHSSPLAVTLDGTVIASAALVDGAEDAESAVREATALGGRVFVGVELRASEVAHVKKWLDDASYECLAFVLGARRKKSRRRKHARG